MSNSTSLLALSLSLLASSACAQVLGFEKVSAQSDAGAADAAPDAMVDPLACAAGEIAPALGTTLGNTDTESNAVELSCGSQNASDRLLAWRAPATDYYVFDTLGSGFDTVLAIFDSCEGTELACNNNTATASDSELVLKIEGDEEVLVAVDGFAGDTGDFSLNIDKVSCPDFDLERQTFPLSFSTASQGDEFFNDCGGNGNPDRAFHWVAPTEGLYAFTLVAPGYRGVLTIIDGPRCQDEQLGCSQAFEADFKAEVVRRLSADQQVSIYVDGVDGSGDFDIDVQKVATTCPSETLVEDEVTASSYETRSMSSSCSFVESRTTVNTPIELGDKTFKIDVDSVGLGCSGFCDIQITSGAPFSASILDGEDCSGAELQCEQSAAETVNLRLIRQESVVQSHTLIVTDRAPLDMGGFTVTMSCQQICA